MLERMSSADLVHINSLGSSLCSSKYLRSPTKRYATRDDTRVDVFDYIECFHNPRRHHVTSARVPGSP